MTNTQVNLDALKAAREDCKPRSWSGHCHIEGDAEVKRQNAAYQKFLNLVLKNWDDMVQELATLREPLVAAKVYLDNYEVSSTYMCNSSSY